MSEEIFKITPESLHNVEGLMKLNAIIITLGVQEKIAGDMFKVLTGAINNQLKAIMIAKKIGEKPREKQTQERTQDETIMEFVRALPENIQEEIAKHVAKGYRGKDTSGEDQETPYRAAKKPRITG